MRLFRSLFIFALLFSLNAFGQDSSVTGSEESRPEQQKQIEPERPTMPQIPPDWAKRRPPGNPVSEDYIRQQHELLKRSQELNQQLKVLNEKTENVKGSKFYQAWLHILHHPQRMNFVVIQVVLLLAFLAIRHWRASKYESDEWGSKLFLSMWMGAIYLFVAVYLLPKIVFGPLYIDFLVGIYETLADPASLQNTP